MRAATNKRAFAFIALNIIFFSIENDGQYFTYFEIGVILARMKYKMFVEILSPPETEQTWFIF